MRNCCDVGSLCLRWHKVSLWDCCLVPRLRATGERQSARGSISLGASSDVFRTFYLSKYKHKNPHPIIMHSNKFAQRDPLLWLAISLRKGSLVSRKPLMATVWPITSTQSNHCSDFRLALIDFPFLLLLLLNHIIHAFFLLNHLVYDFILCWII